MLDQTSRIDASVYDVVFLSQAEEFAEKVTRIEGVLPRDLTGTFLRNGPGYQQIGPDMVSYYDGLGMLSGVGFRDGEAFLRSRHIRSPLFLKEMKAQRQVGRRILSNAPGFWSNFMHLFENVGAHDVYAWGGKLYGTGETAHYALDPKTFETLGVERWGLPPMHQMCLMPRRDPATDRLVGFTVKPGLGGPDLITFVELDRELRMQRSTSAPLRRPVAFVHDVAFTDRFYLVTQMPVKMRMGRLLAGRHSAFSCFEWPEGETPVLTMVPRQGGERIDLPTPPGFKIIFHFFNAYEDGDRVVVDVCGEDSVVDFFSTFPRPWREGQRWKPLPMYGLRTVRYVVDPVKRTIEQHEIPGASGEQPEINPAFNGRRHRFGYLRRLDAHGGEPHPGEVLYGHSVQRIDFETESVQVWNAGPTRFCGQPSFAPRVGGQGEDDGYVLVWVLDGASTETDVVILDARDLARGPVATLKLGRYIPEPQHTCFDPNVDIF